MTKPQDRKEHAPALSRAHAHYVEGGAFEAELARRVAYQDRKPEAARQPARAACAISTRR